MIEITILQLMAIALVGLPVGYFIGISGKEKVDGEGTIQKRNVKADGNTK